MRNLAMSVLLALTANAAFADSWTTPVSIISAYFDNEMPSISNDGSKLFFSSDSDGIANGPADIYYSLKSDSGWGMPIFLGNIVNDTIQGREELSPCIGYDDTTLYFARSYVNDSIWVTYYTNGDWLLPQPLDSTINKFPAGGPAVSQDGQRLYFHSNRPGGYGGYDIWMSQKTGGAWQEPVNMGLEINTPFNEKEPSIAANDSDFVFGRSQNDSDTCNIWYYKLGSGESAKCIFYGHYEPYPHYGWYRYQAPCISWDGQKIYITYAPFNAEPISYIYVSDRVTGVAGKPENSSPKTTLSLSPNPFRRYTSISYQLPISGHVNLSIYNVAGQLVRTLVNEDKMAGKYKAIWDGNDKNNRKATQGAYFCKLESDNGQIIQKMVLIK
jgi:Tol biopolymer transport system component